jgi:nucleotide-binding universal stress UspA family protein
MRKPPKIKKILVPIDFSSSSDKTLDYASTLAKQFNALLILMHVIDSAQYSVTDTFNVVKHRRSLEMIARSLLKNLMEPLLKSQLMVRPYLVSGMASEEILKKARQDRVNLIVMGTHGRTGLQHVFLGSVAEKVVRLSSCPVLTVRLASPGRKTKISQTSRETAVTLF